MNVSLLRKVQAFLDIVESRHQSSRSLSRGMCEADGYDLWTMTIGVEYSSPTDASYGVSRPGEKTAWDEAFAEARNAVSELVADAIAEVTTTQVSLQGKDTSELSHRIEDILQTSGADEIWISCEDQTAHVSGSKTACAAACKSLVQELPPVPQVNFSMQVPQEKLPEPIEVSRVVRNDNSYKPVPLDNSDLEEPSSTSCLVQEACSPLVPIPEHVRLPALEIRGDFSPVWKSLSAPNPFDEAGAEEVFSRSPVGSGFMAKLDVPSPPPLRDPTPPPPPPPPPPAALLPGPSETDSQTSEEESVPDLVAVSSVDSGDDSESGASEYSSDSDAEEKPCLEDLIEKPSAPEPKVHPAPKKSRMSTWWN